MKIIVKNYKNSETCASSLIEAADKINPGYRIHSIRFFVSWTDENGQFCVPTEFGLPLGFIYSLNKRKSVEGKKVENKLSPIKKRLTHGTSLEVTVKKSTPIGAGDLQSVLADVEKRISEIQPMQIDSIAFYL